jgi:hypothetical protein
VDAWLREAADALAREAGVARSQLELDGEAVRTLLDVARIAAHESGERTNAPLVCYLLGVAAAGAENPRDVHELADAVRRSSS